MFEEVAVKPFYKEDEKLALRLGISDDRGRRQEEWRLYTSQFVEILRDYQKKAKNPTPGFRPTMSKKTIERFIDISVGETGEIAVHSRTPPNYKTLQAFHVYLQIAISRKESKLNRSCAAALIMLFKKRMPAMSDRLDFLRARVLADQASLSRTDLLTFLNGDELVHQELTSSPETDDRSNGHSERSSDSNTNYANKESANPEDVVLSCRVVKLPRLSKIFDHPLLLQEQLEWARAEWQSSNRHPYWHVDVLDWIKRGARLYSFELPNSSMMISVLAPVSGLVLYTGGSRVFTGPTPAILVPENEPPPLPASEIFGALCDYCSKHLEDVFLKPSELRDKYARSELNGEFQKQLASECRIRDALESGGFSESGHGSYMGWIEAQLEKTPRPDLMFALRKVYAEKAHLAKFDKQLLDAVLAGRDPSEIPTWAEIREMMANSKKRTGKRAGHVPGRPEPSREGMTGVDDLVEDSGGEKSSKAEDTVRYPQQVDELRIKWELPIGYTRFEVNSEFHGWLQYKPVGIARRIKDEYEQLRSFASDS